MSFTDQLLELKKLNLPPDQFAIFGSGPLAVRNLRATHDLDLLVKPGLFKKLAQKYPVKDDKLIKIGQIEIYKDWQPYLPEVDELIDSADLLNGWRFVKLEYVLKWKKIMGREKDLEDIELIKKYLRSNMKSNF